MLDDTRMAHLRPIAPATGKLGVLLPGLGAVSSTLIAGVETAKKTREVPIGSITQMAKIRLGSRGDGMNSYIKDFVPLAQLDDLVFGGWDPISANALEAARTCGVLDERDLAPISSELEGVVAMDAVFDRSWVSKLDGFRVKKGKTKLELAEQLMADIEKFRSENGCDRLVMVWCGSTEAYREPSEVHNSVETFEQGLRDNHPEISPSQIYTYAALQSRVPYANGAPNLSCDLPCMLELADRNDVPIGGKDFKTGQTLMKEVSKLGVLDTIFQPEEYPRLYGDISHVVRINYYPPRGDNKEGWDNIDIFGWMGYPMQIKVDFLCRDSILAAPLVLDLALFFDLAARAGEKGVQEWLSFYFKSPQTADPALPPEHDIFIQQTKLKNTLREWMGEPAVTHSEAG